MNTINKRIWLCVLLTTLLLLLLTIAAVAVSPISANELVIVSDSYSAPVGEVVEYPLMITNNPGFSYLRLTITFDEGLALEGVKNGDVIHDLDQGVNLLWSADQQTDTTGTLVVLLFRVKAEGEFRVHVNIRECYNDAFDDVITVVNNGIISGGCAHTERVKQDGQPATCVSDGWIGAEYCKTCGEILVAQKVIPATGHSFGEWSEAKAPTCTLNGVEKRSCKICDRTEIRDVAATGHSHKATVTTPTCTEKGYTSHVCHCGDSYVDTYINALGHNFGEWYETKAPTEAAQGEKRRDCKICDAYETTPVAPLSHSHDSWDVITLEAVAPTCTANGQTEGKKCVGCGEILVNQEVIPAVGHNASDWIVDVEPTPGVAGSKHKECVTCGELLETAIIEALPEVIDPETEPETTPETEPETEPDTEVDTEPETEVETELDTEPDTEVETELDTEPDTEVETELDTESDTESETVHETESVIEAETPVITEPISETTMDSVLEGETTATLPSDAGCSGTVQISLLLLLTIILPMAVVIRKKD